MRIDTKRFILTDEQVEIVKPDLDLADAMDQDGAKGVILAQICEYKSLSGKVAVLCEFQFIEKERAQKIVDIVNEK